MALFDRSAVAPVDVVVVGGGIAGSALASVAARQGLAVVVVEQQPEPRDKVRGETITPWGVREVQALGLEEVLIGAGGTYTSDLVQYDELLSPADAEAGALPYRALAPDVPGQLNVGHPEAIAALQAHAAASGATVHLGVSDVTVTAGESPAVSWTAGGERHEARCRLVVGADGRTSTVRRQLGIELQERPPTTYAAGVLFDGDDAFSGRNVLGTAGDAMILAFPRHGRSRLYLGVDIARRREFTGPDRLQAFLRSLPTPAFPASAVIAGQPVAGPCGGSPLTDAWTTTPPAVPGAVLVGDAAGWNDPIIGQGLAIAMRDARSVADVLTGGDDWSVDAFAPYVEERTERMRRLRTAAAVMTAMRCTFGPEARERRARWLAVYPADPVMLMQVACSLSGPESAPADSFTDEAVAATLAV